MEEKDIIIKVLIAGIVFVRFLLMSMLQKEAAAEVPLMQTEMEDVCKVMIKPRVVEDLVGLHLYVVMEVREASNISLGKSLFGLLFVLVATFRRIRIPQEVPQAQELPILLATAVAAAAVPATVVTKMVIMAEMDMFASLTRLSSRQSP